MPIIRSETSKEFFIMHNATAQDKELSWAARGMLGYLLSKPVNWKTNLTDLTKQSAAGRDACRTILAELINKGYIWRLQVRHSGKFGYVTYVYDRPHDKAGNSQVEPEAVQPDTGEPYAVESDAYKELNQKIADLKNTEQTIAPPPSDTEDILGIPASKPPSRRTTFSRANASGDLRTRCVHVARCRFAGHGWPEIDWDLVWEEFEHYWRVEASRKTKVDWPATFYNRAKDRRTWATYRTGVTDGKRPSTGNSALIEAARELVLEYDPNPTTRTNEANGVRGDTRGSGLVPARRPTVPSSSS